MIHHFVKFIKCLFPNKLKRFVKLYLNQVRCYPPIGSGVRKNNSASPKVIVSLTSFPKRIPYAHLAIYTLLHQTYQPDQIILWLGEEQFPNREKDLPKKLLRLQKHGLTIRWTREIRSYTKLIPALREFPDDIIVTADDDLQYPYDWLEKMMDSYEEHPEWIHTHLIEKVTFQDGKFIHKNCWNEAGDGTASFAYRIYTGRGVLFPPHCLDEECFNESIFLSVAPTDDDIWFWAMAIKHQTPVCWIKNGTNHIFEMEECRHTPSLWQINQKSCTQLEEGYRTLPDYALSYYGFERYMKATNEEA